LHEPIVVARIRETPFRMPATLMEDWSGDCDRLRQGVDSALDAAGIEKTAAIDLNPVFESECSISRIWTRYFYDLNRFITIVLRNEGTELARSVSVRIPLRTAQWQKDGAESQTIPLQPMGGAYSIEIGDLRPNEAVQIQAWAGSPEPFDNDSVAVFQASGRTVIEREPRN
jgi:hypothetical protein